MVRYTPFIVLFKISGFCAILDFGFDCIDRKSSKFTKELICKRHDRWAERRVFGLKRTESDSPALCHTKRRVSVSITKSCFIRKTLKLRLRKKPKKITCFREIFYSLLNALFFIRWLNFYSYLIPYQKDMFLGKRLWGFFLNLIIW